jgi:galactarate dehydratase
MVISLGCEKLQPERLLPPGTIPIVDERNVADVGDNAEAVLDVVCLQDEKHVGFMSMVDSIMTQAQEHLERLNARRRETVPASELWSACSAAAAMRFPASRQTRRSATVPICWCAQARP